MVSNCTDDFKVTWKDPADNQLRWGRDRLHLPRPLPPLSQAYGVGLALPLIPGARIIFLNGYAFVARPPQGPPPPQIPPGPPPQEGDWEVETVPKIQEICWRIRDSDWSRLSAVELADSLDGIFQDAVRAFGNTMDAGRFSIGPMVDFFTFCERELPPDGLVTAATLIQGFENESTRSGIVLGELVDLAASIPAVAEALRAGRFAGLESVEGGAEFSRKLQAFLDQFGWRAESWGLMHVPVWAEDPAPALGYVARYLADSDSHPKTGMRRAAEERVRARAEASARLSEEARPRFEALLAQAEQLSRLTEGRALWQLTAAGVLRVPLVALGRKLADAGVMNLPNDIFFLYLDEVKDVARNPRSMHSQIAGRRADLAHWEELNAPVAVGAGGPPPAPPDPVMQAAMRLVLGIGAPSTIEGNVVMGSAASRGVIRATARVIRSLAEGSRLKRGDILVCPSTSPAWVPLFSIAGGVITDSGGILSHSAVCAREFGIPCVVGAQLATTRIPDGATIVLDGTKGTITIED